MQIKEEGNCKVCGEPIKKCYLTRGKDGNYYCAKCLIDLNRELDYERILKRRKKELKKQLTDIEIELGENNIFNVMYH